MTIAIILTIWVVLMILVLAILNKDYKKNMPLLGTVSVALIGILIASCLIFCKNIFLQYIFSTMFFVTHPWFYFFIVWYEYDLLQTKKFCFYKFPSFYISLVLSVIPLGNIGNHRMFEMGQSSFLGTQSYTIKAVSYTCQIYKNLSTVAIGLVIGTLLWLSMRTALIYKSRALGMIIAQSIYFIIEICSLIFSWPIWMLGLTMAPLCIGAAYYTLKYTPNTFKTWALTNFSDNLSDGFILYDEKDNLTYINRRMRIILTQDEIALFSDRNEFIKWSEDREEVNGFKVKRINAFKNNGVDHEFFFDIHEHKLEDDRAYIGVFYNMKDMTSVITRVEELNELNEQLEQVAKMKSDFLANMSHEIRTPMNAVIGMAEMSLREDMTPVAREYIHQIQSSGQALLTIINDILDFSKIESGKMDISLAEYAPMSIAQDEASILLTRVGKKPVELSIDIDPMLPCQLMGDSIRIKQIITNLANNAVKFTEEGQVVLKIGFERIDDRNIMLKCSVTDTGIGIKQENLSKLFQSFNQLDSKRNRNVEGTGLGLAISKQLVELMGGTIGVESEYGRGSCFHFEVPQIVLDNKPSVVIKDTNLFFAAVLTENGYVEQSLRRDIERLGIRVVTVGCLSELKEIASDNLSFAFIGEEQWNDEVIEYAKEHSSITFVLMARETNHKNKLSKNMIEMRKPFYTLNLGAIFNHEDLYASLSMDDNFAIDYIAPEATVLLVDDNEINLTVAEGLIQPLKMRVETAYSGQEAIEKIDKKHYDLIFMDHMMPGMDGIETTHVIRRMYPDYDNVPIIALTANAMEETKAMFLTEGMNDFVAKPIEVAVIVKKIKQWLPDDKIIPVDEIIDGRNLIALSEEEQSIMDGLKVLEVLDIENAVKLLGGESLYLKVVKDYYQAIDKKISSIKHALEVKDYHTFKIDAHSLKSSSKQIGAMELSTSAQLLEKAAGEGDLNYIRENMDSFLEMYVKMKEMLNPLFAEKEVDDSELIPIEDVDLYYIFDTMVEALENLDMDTVEEEYKKLSSHRYEQDEKELLIKIKTCIDEFDTENCTKLLEEWRDVRKNR